MRIPYFYPLIVNLFEFWLFLNYQLYYHLPDHLPKKNVWRQGSQCAHPHGERNDSTRPGAVILRVVSSNTDCGFSFILDVYYLTRQKCHVVQVRRFRLFQKCDKFSLLRVISKMFHIVAQKVWWLILKLVLTIGRHV